MTESAQHRIETAHVRRSPRYTMFFLVGAILGALTALALTFGFHGSEQASPTTQAQYSVSQVFGFLCLVCIPVGMALLGAVALIIDRRMSRRAREVRIDHERVQVHRPDDEPDTTLPA